MRNKKAAVGFIFITLLLDVTGIGIIIPVMPSLIMELTGEGLSAASKYGGWLIFAYAFFQFIFSPIVGALSDKFGRRPVLLVSLFGFGLDYILLALAPDLWWLFVGRVISGIMGASFTTGAAYIADVSPPEKRAANFGLIGAAFGLGFIVGPVIGGLLGEFGPRVPFYAAAVLSLLNWLYGFLILPESLPLDKRREFSWKRANPIGAFKSLKKYHCIYCNFKSSNSKNYNIHVSTQKHIRMTNNDINLANNKDFACVCGKIYKYRQGLFAHRKKCNGYVSIQNIENN
mgnify:CR=1 FL=1